MIDDTFAGLIHMLPVDRVSKQDFYKKNCTHVSQLMNLFEIVGDQEVDNSNDGVNI